MKNTTRVKIPKMYWEKVKILTLNETTGLYETMTEEGYYFPTVNSTFATAKGHKGIWEIIRYVAEAPKKVEVKPVEIEEEETSLIEEMFIEGGKLVNHPVKDIEELFIEGGLLQGALRATNDMTVKELWTIAKNLGFKGCTRWSKSKLIEQINKGV